MVSAESLRAARWFGGKNRTISDTRVLDSVHWTDDTSLFLVEVTYTTGPSETYVLAEQLEQPAVARAVLDRFRGETVPTERGGQLIFRHTHVLDLSAPERLEPVRAMAGEQSNTSIRFGEGLILKLFRRLQFGPNPDVEIGWFLTEHTDFHGTPPVAGSLMYRTPAGCEAALALLQCFERNRGDTWSTTLARLRPVLDGGDDIESLASVRRLGATTAELHLALASSREPEFRPEPISAGDVEAWRVAIDAELHIAIEALAARGIHVDSGALGACASGVKALEGALKTRHHGDYHLGQVLERDDGSFAIIDFEGEPSRPLAQRREKRSPLRDVAGMLRSFDYARTAALRAGDATRPDRLEAAQAWYTAARQAFLTEYLSIARRQPDLLPAEVDAPLAALELEKAAYEVMYELNNRPDWLPIPLAALTAEWR